jgi:agmatine deiminase
MKRRKFMNYMASSAAIVESSHLAGCRMQSQLETNKSTPKISSAQGWLMPDEAEPHKNTWMAFGAKPEIWGKKYLRIIQENIALIARTISRYEPVILLVRPEEQSLAAKLCGASVKLQVCPLDDIWIRDTGPVFVLNLQGELAGIDFNFNGWGNKQEHTNDARVARHVAELASAQLINTSIVAEGGGIEVDGQGTAIITESCILNNNRNPGLRKNECERQLKDLLGLQKIIWLPGIKGKDITDGHTDFYARFTRPGVVVAGLELDSESFDYDVTREHLKILNAATDAKGRKLEVVTLEAPSKIRSNYSSENFAAGYINFYVVNGAVIAPEFGDSKADANARAILGKLFPGRQVVQLNIDGIASGGGGIHCVTLQQPDK